MRVIEQDCLEPMRQLFALGRPGSMQVVVPVRLLLHDSRLHGLSGPGFAFENDALHLGTEFWWDGSSGVRDSELCWLASAFHDAAVAAIDHSGLGWLERRRLRRWADLMYGRICRANGMSLPRAGLRVVGLRVLGPVYRVYRVCRG